MHNLQASSKNLSVVAMSASGLHVFMATATALLGEFLVERMWHIPLCTSPN